MLQVIKRTLEISKLIFDYTLLNKDLLLSIPVRKGRHLAFPDFFSRFRFVPAAEFLFFPIPDFYVLTLCRLGNLQTLKIQGQGNMSEIKSIYSSLIPRICMLISCARKKCI